MHRNRIIAGLLVAFGFAAAMAFLPGPFLFAILFAFSFACQGEFYALAFRGGYRVYRGVGMALGALWLFAAYVFCDPAGVNPHDILDEYDVISRGWDGALLILSAFVILLRALFDTRAEHPMAAAGATFLGFLYAPVMVSFYLHLAQWEAPSAWATTRAGVFLTFYFSFLVKMSDAGAYAVGVPFGRHRLFPRVSPKKSWEGLAGGLAVGMLCGVGLALASARWHWGPEGVFWSDEGDPALTLSRAAVLSLVLVLVGLFGDLIESMFKRAVQTKDSASLIPGIGGFLDTADSLLFSAPLTYYVLVWLG